MSPSEDLLYQIALSEIPQIGDVNAKALVHLFGNAKDIFNAPRAHLEKIEGLGKVRVNFIKNFKNFDAAEEEIKFIEAGKIKPIFLLDNEYPKRLLHCYDSPTLLYSKGNTDLNVPKIISIVGTRNFTAYGQQTCDKIVEGLQALNVLVVSGLAYGIDTIAHKAALRNNLQTVAVVAHGLDRIYPPQNTGLSKDITDSGMILTEFRQNIKPDRQNFPQRNRIVAGMCDALLVVETTTKGGSLITAELGNGYNKDVFAVPGRITDPKSEGCNFLIKNNKASLVNSAEDIIDMMNWNTDGTIKKRIQRQLFIEFTPQEQTIVDILGTADEVSIDVIHAKAKLSSSAVASALLTLEMQNVVASLPGKLYQLL